MYISLLDCMEVYNVRLNVYKILMNAFCFISMPVLVYFLCICVNYYNWVAPGWTISYNWMAPGWTISKLTGLQSLNKVFEFNRK